MPQVPIEELPDHARLWVFAADRTLGPTEQTVLLNAVDHFQGMWAAHGTPLTSGRELRHGRFLLVAVDEQAAGVSGCSIDALTRALRGLEERFGLALLDNGPVHYRDGETVHRVSRPAFRRLVASGAVSAATTVFDNTTPTLGAVRGGRWETAAQNTWVGRAFFG
jgi:hypothetical protein